MAKAKAKERNAQTVRVNPLLWKKARMIALGESQTISEYLEELIKTDVDKRKFMLPEEVAKPKK